MAAVRIRDNGCGIADDKIAKIFNPFYTSKTNGTGLGLGVAKKVIDSHRGTIEVHSKVGQGTEFVLAIPLSDAVRDNDDVVQSSTDESPTTSGAEATAELSPHNNQQWWSRTRRRSSRWQRARHPPQTTRLRN